MYFLIDYENVTLSGFEGSQYLCKDDVLEVFYSDRVPNLTASIYNDILNSGCTLRFFKLVQTGDSALDFYISSRIGELFGLGREDPVVIISKDNDFQAVSDYWLKVSLVKRNVYRWLSIETAISHVKEPGKEDRKIEISQRNIKVPIKNIIAEQEKLKDLQAITGLSLKEARKLNGLLSLNKNISALYKAIIKEFGMKVGLDTYNKLKEAGYAKNKEKTWYDKYVGTVD